MSLLNSILSKHFVNYATLCVTYFVFHSQLRTIRRISFNALQRIPNWYWFVVGAVVVDTLGMRVMVRHGASSPRVLRVSMEGQMMKLISTLLIALLTDGVSSLGTITALKTDRTSATGPRTTDTRTGDTE
nr:hypothetical protein [Vibrio splendidus]